MTRPLALALCLVWTGCAGSYPRTQGPVTQGAQAKQPEEKPGLDISKASMPFKVLRARGGQEITVEAFLDELGRADAVCLGESHTNPHHHWAQLYVVEEVSKRGQGRVMALGMEMFQQPFQGVLDDYAAGRIDAEALLSRAGWNERWGFDFGLYRPIVDTAVARGMALLALNIANELRRKVSSQGIEGLSDEERARLPELDLEDKEHKAWFEGVMAGMAHSHGHGSSGPGSDEPSPHKKAHHPHAQHGHGIYLTQVLWDETMAETAAMWLRSGTGRQVMILAGNGHCHDSAIVRRMRRRGVPAVLSVQPIIDDGQGNVAAELAEPMNDYLFVMSRP